MRCKISPFSQRTEWCTLFRGPMRSEGGPNSKKYNMLLVTPTYALPNAIESAKSIWMIMLLTTLNYTRATLDRFGRLLCVFSGVAPLAPSAFNFTHKAQLWDV